MNANLYGVENGQRYRPADGSNRELLVVDCGKYADCGDIVVRDLFTEEEYRIDAFKLAVVRYVKITKPPLTLAQRQALWRQRKAQQAEMRDRALERIRDEAKTIREAREIAAGALEDSKGETR